MKIREFSRHEECGNMAFVVLLGDGEPKDEVTLILVLRPLSKMAVNIPEIPPYYGEKRSEMRVSIPDSLSYNGARFISRSEATYDKEWMDMDEYASFQPSVIFHLDEGDLEIAFNVPEGGPF